MLPLKAFRLVVSGLLFDIERLVWAQYVPPKPKVVNLLANDICNSKCVMCMIWKRKRDHEITSNDLITILGDPLFSRVEHVGITGGEPTLRKDLPDLFHAVVTTLPKLRGASTITNAIQSEQVIQRIEPSAKVCQEHDIKFSLMISLDGVGKVHDQNRGRLGNFDSAMEVIRYFRENKMASLSVGCTITKLNVWGVEELYDFCLDQRLYIRFRVAEFIERLYNENENNVIRAFDDEEAYFLALFFEKLIRKYERSSKIRRTYQNIQSMLLADSERQTGCPYQSRGVVLDSRGGLQYCAPKSKTIGNALDDSAIKLFKAGLGERRRVLDNECSNCIHDYHAPATIAELSEKVGDFAWRKMISLNRTSMAGRKQ